MQYRARRNRSRIPLATLVGYTNAGKSTLLNRMSGSDVYVADQLFATLDPTTRRVELPGGHLALITDTVGFIQKLPTELVAAFRATLEEIAEADLLLHIIDITHPNAFAQAESVHQTLSEIGAGHIPTLTVLNKIDHLNEPEKSLDALKDFPNAIAISALKGFGIDDLREMISEKLYATFDPIIVRLPYQQGALISMFHEFGQIERIENFRGGVIIHGKIPVRLSARFQPYVIGNENQSQEETVAP
jgi:GTP-binding protein HflX